MLAATTVVSWFTVFMLVAVVLAAVEAVLHKSILAGAVCFIALAFLFDAVVK